MSQEKILLATTCHLEGYQIETCFGLVSAHVASGVNALRGWMTVVRDIVGGKSGSYEKELERLTERAVEQLSEQASTLGANAILGLQFDYSSIGGDRRSMLMLSVSGTACRVKRVGGSSPPRLTKQNESGHWEEVLRF